MSLEDESKIDPAEEIQLNGAQYGRLDVPGWMLRRLRDYAPRFYGRSGQEPGGFPPNWHNVAVALRDLLMESHARHRQQTRVFKEKVAKVALDYAIRYEWCDEVVAALEELDIELDQPTLHVDLTVHYSFDAQVGFNHLTSVSRDGVPFILRHLHVPSLLVEPESADQQTMTITGGMADPVKVEVVDYSLKAKVTEQTDDSDSV